MVEVGEALEAREQARLAGERGGHGDAAAAGREEEEEDVLEERPLVLLALGLVAALATAVILSRILHCDIRVKGQEGELDVARQAAVTFDNDEDVTSGARMRKRTQNLRKRKSTCFT